MSKMLYIPDVLQYSDFDCGDMCVQAVMAYYGFDLNEIKLLRKLKTRTATGVETEHIAEFFKRKNFKVEAREMSISDITSFIDKKIPVIVLAQAWKTSNAKYWETYAFGHYLIAIGYDEKNIYFEDPAIFGKGYIPIKEFKKRWHAEDRKNEFLTGYGIAVWGRKPYNYKKYVRIK